jgi:hypothetical protein
MSFEIEGILIEKYPVQQVTDSFRKREFVIEKKEVSFGREFIDTIKFQLVQDRCEELENFQLNDSLKVTFNIKGRKWEKDGKVNYFNNLEAWKLEMAGQADDHGFQQDAPPPDEADFIVSSDDQNDDLPF